MKFLLVVDTEGGFYYKIPSPHFSKSDLLKWRMNVFRGKLYRYANPATIGIKNIVKISKKYKFPTSFCICGHLYMKNCSGWIEENHAKKPENSWYKSIIGNDWYYWDKRGNEKTFPDFYLGSLKRNERRLF